MKATRWWRAARAFLASVGRLFVPPQCPACEDRLAEPLGFCAACVQVLGAQCIPLEVTPELESGDILRVRALGPYEGRWGGVVRAYKRDPAPGVAALVEPQFADLVRGLVAAGVAACWTRSGADVVGERLAAGGVPGSGTASGAASHPENCWAGPFPVDPGRIAVVPVPMAKVRRRERGFSPAERLAASVAARTGFQALPTGLIRTRYRRPLRGLGAEDRRLEIKGAVVADPLVDWGPFEGVILIDDVFTTGATLEACFQAVRKAAIPRELPVAAAVLAATPLRGSAYKAG